MSKFIGGLFIILIGVYFLLKNMGYDFEIGKLINTYWPVILIFFGLSASFKGLIQFVTGLKRNQLNTGNVIWGLMFAGIGTILLGNELGWFEIELTEIWNWAWPLLIIYFGLSMLFKSGRRRKMFSLEIDSKKIKFDRKKNVIGDIKFGEDNTWNLEDIQLWNGVGSVKIDLTSAILPEKEANIDLTGWVGDITVLVPRELPIKVNVDVRIGEVKVFNHKQSGKGRFIFYESENYINEAQRLNLMISLSVGDVNVKWVD